MDLIRAPQGHGNWKQKMGLTRKYTISLEYIGTSFIPLNHPIQNIYESFFLDMNAFPIGAFWYIMLLYVHVHIHIWLFFITWECIQSNTLFNSSWYWCYICQGSPCTSLFCSYWKCCKAMFYSMEACLCHSV